MTNLSINLNKIALLRNSRGRDYPNVLDFAEKFCALGVQGITIHPRPDERHIGVQDAIDLGLFLSKKEGVELNIEGYPSEEFLRLIEMVRPDQCTLVPDVPNQLTSDHGWDLDEHGFFIRDIMARLKSTGVRRAIFLDPDVIQVDLASKIDLDRVEFYTEPYARAFGTDSQSEVLSLYKQVITLAEVHGIGVNAGHDLDLKNLSLLLENSNVLEVSIGHALIVESIEEGMKNVVERYLSICA